MNKAADDCASRAAAKEKICFIKQSVSLRNTAKEKLAEKNNIEKEILEKREVEVNLILMSF